MKRSRVGNIAVVVGDESLRAAQFVDGRLLLASVSLDGGWKDLKDPLRKLLSAAPFVGRSVVIGMEGSGVLVESVVVPPDQKGEDAVRTFCSDRLKGDPLFSDEQAQLGVYVQTEQEGCRPLAVLAAVNRERLQAVIRAGRALELTIQAIEAAAMAAWRAWKGEGRQARFIGSGSGATVLAGIDDQLLFCRTVPEGLSVTELARTLQRASSLLCTDAFERLVVDGLPEETMERISTELGMAVARPEQQVNDPAAVGLATAGVAMVDFTPADERIRLEKRRIRRVTTNLAGVCGLLVLVFALLGNRQAEALGTRKEALEAQVLQLRDTQTRLAQLREELVRQQANEATIDQARPGHRMSTLFAILAQGAGDDVWLESIRIHDRELPARRAEVSGPLPHVLEVHLAGLASSAFAVRKFANRLLGTGAFADVHVEDSERVLLSMGKEGERFQIFAKAETR